MNTNNRHVVSNTKERNANFQEKRNPVQKIVRLINQYWSIDQMYATAKEKQWAKSRLEGDIKKLAKNLGNTFKSTINNSLRSRSVWEDSRNTLL